MSASGLGISISGTLTHVSALAIALFVLAVISGYTNQPSLAGLLLILGLAAWIFYVFLAFEAYREGRKKRHKSSISKTELLEMILKEKNKYTEAEIDAIYLWLNK
ncbi:MAG TPA: hypothetical protein VGR53_04650 [Nitrososphaerales archaeon]|nr:hypothetical protein [Nitrososphaerales archaeon]